MTQNGSNQTKRDNRHNYQRLNIGAKWNRQQCIYAHQNQEGGHSKLIGSFIFCARTISQFHRNPRVTAQQSGYKFFTGLKRDFPCLNFVFINICPDTDRPLFVYSLDRISTISHTVFSHGVERHFRTIWQLNPHTL